MEQLVSVIIPTYNRAGLIGQTLDSIKAQRYPHWECIVVDDGSSDGTEMLLKSYTDSDPRFQYFIRPESQTKGANGCRNYGFAKSKGVYVKWFDSDDLMHEDFLLKSVAVLESRPELDFCAAFSKIFTQTASDASEDFNPEKTDDDNALYNFIIGELFFLTPAPLWRRDFLNGKSIFDETLHNAHETDFNFRMLVAGAKFTYLTETLFFVRRGHQSIDNLSGGNADSFQSQFDYFDKVYHYLKSKNTAFDTPQANALMNYTIFRKATIYSQIVRLKQRDYARRDLQILIRQVRSAEMDWTPKIQFIAGLWLIWYFQKGYRLIYQKTLDLR